MLPGIVNYNSDSESDSDEPISQNSLSTPKPNLTNVAKPKVRIVVGHPTTNPELIPSPQANDDDLVSDSNPAKRVKLSVANFLPAPTHRKQLANRATTTTATTTTAKTVTSFMPASVRDKYKTATKNPVAENSNDKKITIEPTKKTTEQDSLGSLGNLFNIAPTTKASGVVTAEKSNYPPPLKIVSSIMKTSIDVGPMVDNKQQLEQQREQTTGSQKENITMIPGHNNTRDMRGFLPRSHRANNHNNPAKISPSQNNMVEFSIDSFYQENQRLKSEGKLEISKRPIVAVSGSKHSLQALVNKAKDNKEGYEEMFAGERGKRGNVGEGGGAVYDGR